MCYYSLPFIGSVVVMVVIKQPKDFLFSIKRVVLLVSHDWSKTSCQELENSSEVNYSFVHKTRAVLVINI